MSIATIACDQDCGAQLFTFANLTTCPDCRVRLDRELLAAATKAVQWDDAMAFLDRLPLRYPLQPTATLVQRLEDFWRQVNE